MNRVFFSSSQSPCWAHFGQRWAHFGRSLSQTAEEDKNSLFTVHQTISSYFFSLFCERFHASKLTFGLIFFLKSSWVVVRYDVFLTEESTTYAVSIRIGLHKSFFSWLSCTLEPRLRKWVKIEVVTNSLELGCSVPLTLEKNNKYTTYWWTALSINSFIDELFRLESILAGPSPKKMSFCASTVYKIYHHTHQYGYPFYED